MLELNNIEVRVNDRILFRSEDITLQQGVIALAGRNGSGKTTFLKAVLGEHSNFTGKILLKSTELKKIDKKEKSKLLSVVYSRAEVFGNLSVNEILLLGRLPYQGILSSANKDDMHHLNQTLDWLHLKSMSNNKFRMLSDGEKQLVMIGRALMQDTPIILMDEPAAFLDLVNRKFLNLLLKKIAAEKNKLIICSTHHLDNASKEFDQMLMIHNQKLFCVNDPKNFEESIEKTFFKNEI